MADDPHFARMSDNNCSLGKTIDGSTGQQLSPTKPWAKSAAFDLFLSSRTKKAEMTGQI